MLTFSNKNTNSIYYYYYLIDYLSNLWINNINNKDSINKKLTLHIHLCDKGENDNL